MNCDRCDGLMIPAYGEEPPDAIDYRKCMSCGNRRDVGVPDPKLEDGMARQGWTPERRKKFQATMAKKRGKPIIESKFDDCVVRLDKSKPAGLVRSETCIPAPWEPLDDPFPIGADQPPDDPSFLARLRGALAVLRGRARAV
jgi:hypothetical protein